MSPAVFRSSSSAGIPITDPMYFSQMSLKELAHVLRSDNETDMPMLQERHEVKALYLWYNVLHTSLKFFFLACKDVNVWRWLRVILLSQSLLSVAERWRRDCFLEAGKPSVCFLRRFALAIPLKKANKLNNWLSFCIEPKEKTGKRIFLESEDGPRNSKNKIWQVFWKTQYAVH